MNLSPWRIEWNSDRVSYVATHVSSLIVWVSRSGFATVAHLPDSMSEDEAKKLMHEAIEFSRRQNVLH